MSEIATILIGAETSSCMDPLMEVLKFFGVKAEVATPLQFLTDDLTREGRPIQTRVLCSCSTLCEVLQRVDHFPKHAEHWRKNVHSVFVCADEDSSALGELERRIVTHDDYVPLVKFDHDRNQWVISDKCPDFCGAMSGLRIPANQGLDQVVASLQMTGEQGTVFGKGVYETVPIFLLAGDTIVDVHAPVGDRNFDIREHFLEAAPIVMFVKWAFGKMCWHADDANACLVIDDPLLRPSYGFLNYQHLIDLMEQHNFTTNVAFIPWNWRRCEDSVVDLIRNHSDRYSISIHGCDHTGGEFGTTDIGKLVWKSRQAIDRMTRMEAEWGIPHDRIMVFPQGVFSGASLMALKNTQYLAAVNTEVLSHGVSPLPIAISDVWDVAVMSYSSFPIFTRRYLFQGVENFAFDILLGKPCIIVGHHDICQNHSAYLVDFVDRLNSLNGRPSWCSLGELVRRSCRQREVSTSSVEVEMYGSELRLKNDSTHRRHYRISRRETDGSAIKEVRADSHPIPWKFVHDHIWFESELAAGQSVIMTISFHEQSVQMHYRENLQYRAKVMLRRYLSEIRDNYAAVWRTKVSWVFE